MQQTRALKTSRATRSRPSIILPVGRLTHLLVRPQAHSAHVRAYPTSSAAREQEARRTGERRDKARRQGLLKGLCLWQALLKGLCLEA